MPKKEIVILLHGLGRTSRSMHKLAKYLSVKGYEVANINYPSTKLNIEQIVSLYVAPLINEDVYENYQRIHFVTHSMGGILVRYYLRKAKPEKLGRVVMLAPPNQGSEVADWLKDFILYRRVLGPAGQELGTESTSIPNTLGDVDFELGVIAGDRSINWINSLRISGANDGKVAVEKTKIKEMQDFLIVPKTHTWIMKSPKVFNQIDHFLRWGFFHKEGKEHQ